MADAFSAIVNRQMSRRALLGTAIAGAGLFSLRNWMAQAEAAPTSVSTLDFTDLPQTLQPDHAVAAGYKAQRLISWGDPVLKGAATFDPTTLSPEPQKAQFGFNNDFVAYLPLPRGSQTSDHGLLWVNFEYASVNTMLPKALQKPRTKEHTLLEMAAHGGGVVEIKRENGAWAVVPDSQYARRITAETEITISGPAAGNERMKTSADASGANVLGMLNNCGGGVTPWGTVLTCEENFNTYFSGPLPKGSREEAIHGRLFIRSVGGGTTWGKDFKRFDRSREPNEANRFGWVVEVDPYDPNSKPVKRTALGRFKHEAATTVLASDGRVVVYMGDDQVNEYLYKYVSAKAYDPNRPGLEQGLLDEGTLYVAAFTETQLEWRPLMFGQGALAGQAQFTSQADVLVETRHAAEIVGATPMDRPEDVETSPVSGKVYVMLTGNSGRGSEQINPPNPRNWNQYGHVLELTPPNGADGKPDHTASTCAWDVLLLAGFEAAEEAGKPKPMWSAKYGPGTSVVLMNPDSCAFDPKGRLWIGTDSAHELTGRPDGLYGCDLDGPGRAVLRLFYTCPIGAELCGPAFTPDGETLFVAVQHPGEDSMDLTKPHWPDFKIGMPPRPSLVVITREGGGMIGG